MSPAEQLGAQHSQIDGDPELKFLIDLVTPLGRDPRSGNPSHPSDDFDWLRFLKLARWHRLCPVLSQDNLRRSRVPLKIIAEIATEQQTNAIKSLNRKQACVKICQRLKNAEIDCLVVKGPAIEQQLAVHRISRHSGDLDLLITSENLPRATKLLASLGYHPIPGDLPSFDAPDLSPKQREFLKSHENHLRLIHDKTKLIVEIHWKLSPSPFLWAISFPDLWKRRTTFSLAHQQLHTLSPPDHLIFLVIHGAFHAWFRLFWLYEFAILYSSASRETLDAVHKIAFNEHGNRALSAALTLTEYVFGFTESTLSNPRSNSRTHPRMLTNYPLLLSHSFVSAESRTPVQSLRHAIYHFALLPSFKAKRHALWLLAISPKDFESLRLPDPLFRLYTLARPTLWLLRKMGRKRSLPRNVNAPIEKRGHPQSNSIAGADTRRNTPKQRAR